MTTTQKVRLVKKEVEGIRLSLASILLVLCCTFFLVYSSFIQLNVTHFIVPENIFHAKNLVFKDFVYVYKLVPQIPVVMFIGAFLGRKYGIASVLLYILLGLVTVPVFALGGGPGYIAEYGFGYILAYIPAIFFAGSILKSGFANKNILKAVLVGVLTIHLIGIFYMLFIAELRHEGWTFMSTWICAQSGIKIIYDFVLSFFAVFITRYARILLWFFM